MSAMRRERVAAPLLLAAGLFAAFGVNAGADAAAGETKAAVCSACHGPGGNSMVPLFPKLAGQHEKYLIKQLQDIKAGVRVVPEMAAIVPMLADQDIADIAAYYSSQKVVTGQAKPDLAAKGESIYRGGSMAKGLPACTGCHGPDGKGNGGAGFPALAGQQSDYIEKQLRAFRQGAEEPDAAGSRTNDGESRRMRDVASRLSDLEIRSVASFLSGLHSQ